MANKTLYDVLEEVMSDYTYTLKKEKKNIEITGTVFIKRLGREVTYNKEFFCEDDNPGNMETRIRGFKDEFKKMVANVIKENKDILLNDDKLIEKLYREIAALKQENEELKEKNKAQSEEIYRFESERVLNVPNQPCPNAPFTTPDPTYPSWPSTTPWPNPYPWGPQIWCSNDTTGGKGHLNIDPLTGFAE